MESRNLIVWWVFTRFFSVFQESDLFEKLTPVHIQQALSAFNARKQELVQKEVNKLKESSNLLNELLSSMNLPAALEDTTGIVNK